MIDANHIVFDADFWLSFGFGFLGLMGSLLAKRADPNNDSVSGGFREIVLTHSLSSLIAAITYTGAAVALQEQHGFGLMAAFGCGYMIEDIAPRLFGAVGAKIAPSKGD